MFNAAVQVLELRAAIRADRHAKAAARQRAIDATMPLTQSRLSELCELGERMQRTEARVRDAQKVVNARLAQ